MRDAALAAKLEAHVRPANLRMPVVHRRQPDGAVGPRVFLVADANQRFLEQLHRGGEHLDARQPALADVGGGAPADLAKRQREGRQLGVLRLVAHLAESRVIAVLLAPARVASGRLQMTVRVGADPDADPGRRDDERFDAGQLGGVHRAPARVQIAEPSWCAEAPNPRCAPILHVAEAGDMRRVFTHLSPSQQEWRRVRVRSGFSSRSDPYQATSESSNSLLRSSGLAGRGDSLVTRCCGSVPSTSAGMSDEE